MCQKIKNLIFFTLIQAVLAVILFPMASFAGESSCSVTIPVKAEVSGSNVPSDMTYRMVMEAVTAGAPMPAAAELTGKNGETVSFGPITYTVPEDYQYRVSQKYSEKEHFTFDSTAYMVTVRILNGDNGALISEVWASPESDQGKKSGSIVFRNAYEEPTKPSGGGSGGHSGGNGGGEKTKNNDGPATIIDKNPPLIHIFPEEISLAELPKTGDTTNFAFWMLLMAISGCGLVLSGRFKKH